VRSQRKSEFAMFVSEKKKLKRGAGDGGPPDWCGASLWKKANWKCFGGC